MRAIRSRARRSRTVSTLGCAVLPLRRAARADLQFFGNPDARRLFAQAVAQLEALGGAPGRDRPAPRSSKPRACCTKDRGWPSATPRSAISSTRTPRRCSRSRARSSAGQGLAGGRRLRRLYRLKALRRRDAILDATSTAWSRRPPAPSTRIAEVEADPIRLNSNLGYYTNFMNLLDYSAIAVPAGFQGDGLPFGVTLFAPGASGRAPAAPGRTAAAAGCPRRAPRSAVPASQPSPTRSPLPARCGWRCAART